MVQDHMVLDKQSRLKSEKNPGTTDTMTPPVSQRGKHTRLLLK